jgi:hypothetical protein
MVIIGLQITEYSTLPWTSSRRLLMSRLLPMLSSSVRSRSLKHTTSGTCLPSMSTKRRVCPSFMVSPAYSLAGMTNSRTIFPGTGCVRMMLRSLASSLDMADLIFLLIEARGYLTFMSYRRRESL